MMWWTKAIFETKLLVRNPLKLIAIGLFALASVYALQTGFNLYKAQLVTISEIEERQKEFIDNTLSWYDEGKPGPESRPWIDVTTPFWAVWHAPTWGFKRPSPMMTFSVGQTESFGYYKNITFWSTVFDNDLAEEIANPERLAIGSLDFSFMIIYLLPILMIILLFDIGGRERDQGYEDLIMVQTRSRTSWLLFRYVIYFCLLTLVILVPMFAYGVFSGSVDQNASEFSGFILLTIVYLLGWLSIFYIIAYYGRGRADLALKMVTIWIILGIVIPGTVHEWTSRKFPPLDMTVFIDAKRDDARASFQQGYDSMQAKLIQVFPELSSSPVGLDTAVNPRILNNSASAIANSVIKPVAEQAENLMEDKNQFIISTYWFNPVAYVQNKLNSYSETDFYAYKKFREGIQNVIDKKTRQVVMDSWNEKSISKEDYLEYLKSLAYE